MNDYLEPEEVEVDMNGIDYNAEPIIIDAISQVKNIKSQKQYDTFVRYDDAGWLPNKLEDLKTSKHVRDEVSMDEEEWLDQWLVAARDDNDGTAVFLYGDGGALVPATERWKKSKKLKHLNQKSGVFENLKTFKQFISIN